MLIDVLIPITAVKKKKKERKENDERAKLLSQ